MNLDGESETPLTTSQSRQYSALRSDLSAALSAFDRAQDWADLIHDLQRVNRVLNKHSNTTFLPDTYILAKRLAQCLTSFLPSGVHLKALETYHIIFNRIGKSKLSIDISIYAGGLFPLLSHCSTSLKNPLLSLYEQHFLPLKSALLPVLDGFILAILPGLEDQTSEFFARCIQLLDNISLSVNNYNAFSKSIWNALLLSPPNRFALTHYLRHKFNSDNNNNSTADNDHNGSTHKSSDDSVFRSYIFNDMPLIAYAISAALSDNDSLTQRNVLDLLLNEIKLNNSFFQNLKLNQKAAVTLVGGVFQALLRKDISLTKRVHTWLLGGHNGKDAIGFCNQYSKHLILLAIDNEIRENLALYGKQEQEDERQLERNSRDSTRNTNNNNNIKKKDGLKPCKIIMALLDRDELCDCLGNSIARRTLDYGRLSIAKSHQHTAEINDLIINILQDIGNEEIFKDLKDMMSQKDDYQITREDFELLSYALAMFPIDNENIRQSYLPSLLKVVIHSLNNNTNNIHNNYNILDKAILFCSKAITVIAGFKQRERGEQLVRIVQLEQQHINMLSNDLKQIISDFANFFVKWLDQNIQTAPIQLIEDYNDVDALEEYSSEIKMSNIFEEREEVISITKNGSAFFVIYALSGFSDQEILKIALDVTSKCTNAGDARISLAGARAFSDITLKLIEDEYELGEGEVETDKIKEKEVIVNQVIRRCWKQLHPSLRTATAQSAQTLSLLQKKYPEQVQCIISDGMLSSILSRRLRNLERFACLWRLSVENRLFPLPMDNGLFLMLDALTDEHWGPKMLARSWLSDSLQVDPGSIIDAPLKLLLTKEARTVGGEHQFQAIYDAPRALYAFQNLRSILENIPTALGSTNTASNDDQYSTHAPTSSQAFKNSSNNKKFGINALASTPPSPRIVQSLATVFEISAHGYGNHEAIKEAGKVKLSHLLPVHNYVVTIALTSLSYLRGKVPQKFQVKHDLLKLDHSHFSLGLDDIDNLTKDNFENEEEDLEWTLAGLGFKSMLELHQGISAAAAECLASLLNAIPTPSNMSNVMANLFAQPVLDLIIESVGSADPVLELHFLDAMSFLITAYGPYYKSSVLGKDLYSKSKVIRSTTNSMHDNASQIQGIKNTGGGQHVDGEMNIGATESLDAFIPWLLSGVANACIGIQSNHDNGSQEVLGVKRRWIQLIDTVMKHIGLSLPIVTEGLILILCQLLERKQEDNNDSNSSKHVFPDSEFSRVDETLVLLEGLSVVTSNVLLSFEYALANSQLKEGTQSTPFPSVSSLTSSISSNTQPTSVELSTRSLPALTPAKDGVAAGSSNVANSKSSTGDSEGHVNGSESSPNQHQPSKPNFVQSSISEALPSLTGNVLMDKSTSMSTATSSMMNALNPLRMINDFVKDVWTGSGADSAHRSLDARRSGTRAMFCLMPTIIRNIAHVWGPSPELDKENVLNERDLSAGVDVKIKPGNSTMRSLNSTNSNRSVSDASDSLPRLSTELPRERRHAQHAVVLSILEPIFEIRPLDVIAGIISLFYEEQDEFGVLPLGNEEDSPARMACDMLHSLDAATPEVVAFCVKMIFEKAVKWEIGLAEATEGKAQEALRQKARSSIKEFLNKNSPNMLNDVDISMIGKMAPTGYSSPVPGGTTGIDLAQIPSMVNGNSLSTSPSPSSGHQELFHWGDYFAIYPSTVIETACLNFMEQFLSCCSDNGSETHASWSILFPLLRDGITSARRKTSIPALLRLLGTFVSKNKSPFPDRRIRREIVLAGTLIITSCGSLANGQVDISSHESSDIQLFKKKLSVVALRALSIVVSPLMDSAFLDDKPQLASTINLGLGPAVSILKKAASRSSAIILAANNGGSSNSWKIGQFGSSKGSPRAPGIDEKAAKQEAETAVDLNASEAAADIILSVGSYDWGAKSARHKLLALIEDGNFFYGKNRKVLHRISTIVKDVISNNGAAFLFTALSTWSSNTGAGGIPGLFIGRDSETVLRGRSIRRMAYIVFVSEPGFYSSQLPMVLERIRDVLRTGSNDLIGECLFCLRAILLRNGPTSITAFRATVLAEMFRILGKPKEDLQSTMSALRFLDLIALLAPPDYGYERCFFFGENDRISSTASGIGHTGDVNDNKTDNPDNLESMNGAEDDGNDLGLQKEYTGYSESAKAFVPLVDSVASTLWKGFGWTKEEIFISPLRMEVGKPVLSGGTVANADVNEEFVGRYAAGLVVRNSVPMMKAGDIDHDAIFEEFEAEFLQEVS